MKKRIVLVTALIIAAAMAFAGGKGDASAGKSKTYAAGPNLNAAGSLPIAKEPVTLKVINVIADNDEPTKDILTYQEAETATNVKIMWEDINQTAWRDKKGLIMASGDMPDVIMGRYAFTDIDVNNYGSQGLLLPLNNLLQFAPNFTKAMETYPEIKKMATTTDGNIYAIPSFDDGFVPDTDQVMYINKVWLDKVGLKVPTTFDELHTVLKAFKTMDPNGNGKADEIPLSIVTPRFAMDWFASFGVYDDPRPTSLDAHIMVKDGKVLYSAVQPGYKEAIKYFNKLFSEGLVDQESFTQNLAAFNAKLRTAPTRVVGVFVGWRSTAWATPGYTDDYIAIAPFKGPAGTLWPRYAKGLFARNAFTITASCKDPVLAMLWANYLLSRDVSMQNNVGYKLGVSLRKVGDNKYEMIRPMDVNLPGEKKLVAGAGEVFIVTKEMRDAWVAPPPHMVEKFALDKIYAPYLIPQSWVYPPVLFGVDENSRLAQYQSDIIPYVNGLYAKWMTSGGIDAEWDAYVARLNTMGLQDMLKIYQSAYDRYMK